MFEPEASKLTVNGALPEVGIASSAATGGLAQEVFVVYA